MAVTLHEEIHGRVVDLQPWGCLLELADGTPAAIDNMQTQTWRSAGELPSVGHELRVVVLDDRATPVRVSSVTSDFAVARRLR